MNYYKKKSSSEALKLDTSKTYYANKNFDSKIDFPKIEVFTSADKFDLALADQYYIYDQNSGRYNYCGVIDRFQKKYSYFIKELVSVVPYSVNQLYEYKGYQAATAINPTISLEYYTRQTTIDAKGEKKYAYKKAFSLQSNVTYYQLINGTEYEVSSTYSFTKGQTYYMKNADGITIGDPLTIPKANLYIDEGFVKVEYLNPIKKEDICYFLDDNGFIQKVDYSNKSNACVMGKTNIIYKNCNNELAAADFEEGDYYILENNNPVKYTVLKKYNIHKTYYTAIEEYLQEDTYTEGEPYFFSSLIFYDDSKYRKKYYAYDNWYKFKEFPNFVCLYIVTTGEGKTGTAVENGQPIERNFVLVDRDNAIYNESITYYIQCAQDKKLYPLPKTLDATSFYSLPFVFYKSVVDKHIDKAIHCKYANSDQIYYESDTYDIDTYWNKQIENPETLNFWFDFLDTEGDISRYSNQAVGNRPKAENDSNVKAIYYRETPEVIFVDEDVSDEEFQKQKQEKQGYTFIRMNAATENLFTISAQGKSAQDELDNLLYSNTYCTESVSITCLPVYHLQPNTRIFIRDDKSGINGEYIITKITIPLAYNGMMNISATKAVERIY